VDDFIWLRIWTSGELFWARQWIFVFRKRQGISWQAVCETFMII
jgi:hypothetical protein